MPPRRLYTPIGAMPAWAATARTVTAPGPSLMSAGFLVAAGTTVDSAYWGRIIIAMVLMSAGWP